MSAPGVRGDRSVWESHQPFRKAIADNPIRILDLSTMLSEIDGALRTTLANTEVGRMLQLMKAAGWRQLQAEVLVDDRPAELQAPTRRHS